MWTVVIQTFTIRLNRFQCRTDVSKDIQGNGTYTQLNRPESQS